MAAAENTVAASFLLRPKLKKRHGRRKLRMTYAEDIFERVDILSRGGEGDTALYFCTPAIYHHAHYCLYIDDCTRTRNRLSMLK